LTKYSFSTYHVYTTLLMHFIDYRITNDYSRGGE